MDRNVARVLAAHLSRVERADLSASTLHVGDTLLVAVRLAAGTELDTLLVDFHQGKLQLRRPFARRLCLPPVLVDSRCE